MLIKKKPRSTIITVDFGEITSMNDCKFSSDKIEMLYNDQTITPKIAIFNRQHERKNKKDKTLSALQLNPHSLSFNIFSQILSYDHIYAIDTNCKIINEIPVSCACIIDCVFDDRNENLTYGAIQVFELWNAVDSEKAAWQIFIETLIRQPNYSPTKKYALIVDAYLNEHSMYNNRKLPIIENYFLPENFCLIYASADKSDNILNTLIKYADSVATKTLTKIQKLDTSSFLSRVRPVKNRTFTHFRGHWLDLQRFH